MATMKVEKGNFAKELVKSRMHLLSVFKLEIGPFHHMRSESIHSFN